MNAPIRRFHLHIDIQADELPALRRALARVNELIEKEPPSISLCSGGYDSGYWYTLTERPEITHDKYVIELEAYLEEERKQAK